MSANWLDGLKIIGSSHPKAIAGAQRLNALESLHPGIGSPKASLSKLAPDGNYEAAAANMNSAKAIGNLADMQGWFMGAQMATAIIGAVGQIWTGILRSNMVKSSLAHAETMDAMEYGKHDKDGKLIEGGMAQYEMDAKSKLNGEIKEIATEGMKVTEERGQAEGRKAVQTELFVEARKTEKAGEIDQAPLDELFPDPRRRYERGSPEVHA